MNITSIEKSFKEKVSEKLSVVSEGVERYRVLTPFMFEDGDHLSIVIKRENDKWKLSDEGHTYMHLTYDLDERDLHRGTRQKIISNALLPSFKASWAFFNSTLSLKLSLSNSTF